MASLFTSTPAPPTVEQGSLTNGQAYEGLGRAYKVINPALPDSPGVNRLYGPDTAPTAKFTPGSIGGLLSVNASGIETDATAWESANAGTTRGRSTTVHHAGVASLSVVRNTTGALARAQLVASERVAVTPGDLVEVECWATSNSTDGGRVGAVSLQWYDSGGTLISTTTGADVNLEMGTWEQLTVSDTAPASAVKVGILFGLGAGDGSTTFTFYGDEFSLSLTPFSGISQVGTSSGGNPTGSAATTHNVSVPAGTAVSDVAIVEVTIDGNIFTKPAGWTALTAEPVGALANPRFYVYRRVLDGTSADNFSGTTGAAAISSLNMIVFRGVDTATPEDAAVSSAGDTSLSASAIVSGFDVITDGAWLYTAVAANSQDVGISFTPPAGFTEVFESTIGKKSASAVLGPVAPGPTGNKTWTLSSGRNWAVALIALRPANSGSSAAWVTRASVDFTSLSALPAGWTTYNGGASWGWYLPSHVVVGGGVATLIHKYDASGPATTAGNGGSARPGFNGSTGAGFYQGAIRTPNTILTGVDYRITVRQRRVNIAGTFPYAWRNMPLMWPNSNTSHPDGEDDLMESAGDNPATYNVNIHYGPTAPGSTAHIDWPAIDDTAWHTYRFQRSGQMLTWWVDDMVTPLFSHTYTTTELVPTIKHAVWQQDLPGPATTNPPVGTTGEEHWEISSIVIDEPAPSLFAIRQNGALVADVTSPTVSISDDGVQVGTVGVPFNIYDDGTLIHSVGP